MNWLLPFILTATVQGGGPLDLSADQASRSVVFLSAPAADGKHLSIGSGFLVGITDRLFLVTASHVQALLTKEPRLTYGGVNDEAVSVFLDALTGKPEGDWVISGENDVAVLELSAKSTAVTALSSRALQPGHLINKLEAPSRERELTTIGFPLGLGVVSLGPDKHVSPISRVSRPASGLITFTRADTRQPANFYFLDSPSIGGFSGAPVFMLPGAVVSSAGIGFTSPAGFCVGLVHGTLPDESGGKLAAIVPVFYITQTLEKAFARSPK